MEVKKTEKNDPYAVLKIGEYRLFIVARLVIILAIQIQSIAVGWQVYSITKDPLSLGFIGLVEAIPYIMVSLYAGYVADTNDRRKIIILSLTGLLFCNFLLLMFTLDIFQKSFSFNIMYIYLVILLTGIGRGFLNPAQFGLVSQIVPKELYANSSLWNSTFFQIGLISGPALGGILYGFTGITFTYLVDTILVIIAIILIFFIKPKEKPSIPKTQSIYESLKEGVKFVFGNQVILGAMSLDLFAVLFGGAVAMLPVFADQVLNVGPEGLGVLRASPAIGAAIMSYAMAHNPNMEKAGRNLLLAVTGFGFCMIFFALSTNFWLSLILLALSGAFDSISVIIRSTIVQIMTPDNMRGRVSSVNNIFIGSSNEIGSFESGVAAKMLGLIPSVVFGGCMTLSIVVFTFFKADKLRNLDLSISLKK